MRGGRAAPRELRSAWAGGKEKERRVGGVGRRGPESRRLVKSGRWVWCSLGGLLKHTQ